MAANKGKKMKLDFPSSFYVLLGGFAEKMCAL